MKKFQKIVAIFLMSLVTVFSGCQKPGEGGIADDMQFSEVEEIAPDGKLENSPDPTKEDGIADDMQFSEVEEIAPDMDCQKPANNPDPTKKIVVIPDYMQFPKVEEIGALGAVSDVEEIKLTAIAHDMLDLDSDFQEIIVDGKVFIVKTDNQLVSDVEEIVVDGKIFIAKTDGLLVSDVEEST